MMHTPSATHLDHALITSESTCCVPKGGKNEMITIELP